MEAVDRVTPGFPVVMAINRYGICPLSIISDTSKEIWSIYNTLQGVSRVSTPKELYEIPIRYVEACSIIEDESRLIPRKEHPNGNK